MLGIFLFFFFLLFGSFPSPENQDDDTLFFRAEDHFSRGDYRAAIQDYEKLIRKNPRDGDAAVGLLHALLEVGQYKKAEEELKNLSMVVEEEGRIKILAIELYRIEGKYEEAGKILETMGEEDFRVHALKGLLYRDWGKREKALSSFEKAVDLGAGASEKDARGWTLLGKALWAVRRYQDAVEAFSNAKEEDPFHYEAYVQAANLFLEKYQEGDAFSVLNLAQAKNPHCPKAHLVRAKAYQYQFRISEASDSLSKALAVNPNLVDALWLESWFLLSDGSYGAAQEVIERALEINPRSLPVLSLKASLHFLKGDIPLFEGIVEQILRIDRNYGEVYYTLATLLEYHHRYEEALDFCKKAVDGDPTLWKAYDGMGRYALYCGKEEEGLDAFRYAQKKDPFLNPWRENHIILSRRMGSYVIEESPHFIFRAPRSDWDILKEYLPALLEEAYRDLSRRYRFRPQIPILFDILPDTQSFSVRVSGTLEVKWILGACFGKMIALQSPRAREEGSFLWSSSAWHEFAHVIHLQMTGGKVPRWFTEGLAVYEEKLREPRWERVQDLELATAWHQNRLIPVMDMNSIFRTPRIGFAYAQGAMMCEMIDQQFGFSKLVSMLHAFRKGLDTKEVLTECLEMRPDAFDAAFFSFMEKRFNGVRVSIPPPPETLEEWREKLEENPEDPDALVKISQIYFLSEKPEDARIFLGRALKADPKYPPAYFLWGKMAFQEGQEKRALEHLNKGFELGGEDFFSRLRSAFLYLKEKKDKEAEETLLAAKRAFPRYVGPDAPERTLSMIFRTRGEEEPSGRELEEYIRRDPTDVQDRMVLAVQYREGKRWADLIRVSEELLSINPFEPDFHRLLQEGYREEGAWDNLARELRVLRALLPEEEVPLTCELAGAYLKAGRREEAFHEFQKARAKDPGHEKVLQLEGCFKEGK